jgi:ferredoxin
MCDKYGEGGLWYLNPKLYARQMYKLKEPERPAMTTAELLRIRNDEPERYPEALAVLNKDIRNHAAGQVITLQEACQIADMGVPMASMMCVCRQVDRAFEERSEKEYSCLGTGVGMFKWERWPERYKGGVHFMPPDEVKDWLKKWNKRGFMHMIMTVGVGYIEGICNCEYPACQSIRDRLDLGVESLLKGHYIARVDYASCNGCGVCVQRCQFGAAKFEVRIDKANVDPMRCFGCGLCETGCPKSAITMIDKTSLPGMREVW